MAIRMVDGVPGSGKSYYAVKHLAETYFECDHAGFYKPKQQTGKEGQDQKLIISTNLECLKLPHISLEDEIREAGGVANFFSHKYQESIEKDDEKRIYVVDEAQKYFRKRVTGDWSDTWFYFEKHRHFGHDIYLLTQNPKKVNLEITDLLEYRIHAKPRVRSITGELSYQLISDGDVMKRFGVRPDQKIFDLYKSRRKGETEKISNPIMKQVAIAVCAILFVGACGFYFLKERLSPSSAVAAVAPEHTNTSPGHIPVNNSSSSVPSSEENTEPTTRLVPMSFIVLYKSGKEVNYLFMKGQYFTHDDCPYPLKAIGGKLYAELDSREYERLYSESHKTDKTPNSTL